MTARPPLTLADAGRVITAEHEAMKALLAVAEDEVRWRGGSPNLLAAVNTVREAARR
jgi:hypothetical protein